MRTALNRIRARLGRGPHTERGAAVVEYALIVSLLVLGTTAAITSLEDDAEDYYDSTSDQIGDLPKSAIPSLTLPGGGTVTTTTQVPTTTSTTAPPSTGPTSSTTSTTTSTTVPAQTTITQLLRLSRAQPGDTWRARIRITLEETKTGLRVIGATVTGEFEGYGTRQCVTDNRGRCNVSWYVPDTESSVTYRVTDVDARPPWDGSGAAISLPNPE